MLFLEYPPCSTCKRAKQWLDDHGLTYETRNIKTVPPTKEELSAWYRASGLSLRRFFNTSGLLYKSMHLKDRLPGMTEDEMLSLLASDGMLVKRPLLIKGDRVLVGFKETLWAEITDRKEESN